MGCISTDELLYYLNEQLNICFDKNADKKIGRIIIDDLQKIDYPKIRNYHPIHD